MTIVRTMIAASLLAGGLAIPTAAASAAPSGPLTADAVVMNLQAAGNRVIVNRTGAHELSQCMVTSIRPGQTFKRYDSGYPGAGNDPATQVISMTVYVDAAC